MRFPFPRRSVFIVSLPQTPLRTISRVYLLMLCKVGDYKQVLVFSGVHINQALILFP